jgi:hypothetical protein
MELWANQAKRTLNKCASCEPRAVKFTPGCCAGNSSAATPCPDVRQTDARRSESGIRSIVSCNPPVSHQKSGVDARPILNQRAATQSVHVMIYAVNVSFHSIAGARHQLRSTSIVNQRS